jgi:repressor LexA
MKSYDRLSERQRNILRYMEGYITENGFPPTIREIGLATGINSTSVVNYNLNKLVQAGYLTRSGRVSRGLRMTNKTQPGMPAKIAATAGVKIPMYGQIVASKPVQMPEDTGHRAEEMLDIPPMLLSGVDPAQVYALRVKGDSMIDAMIADGDIVLLRHQEEAKDGDMVAVWLTDRNETTLKYFYREGDKVRLKPAHPDMQPFHVPANVCRVQGRVLSVIRRVD